MRSEALNPAVLRSEALNPAVFRSEALNMAGPAVKPVIQLYEP